MNYLNGAKTFIDNQPIPQVIKIMAILAAVGGFFMILAALSLFGAGALATGFGFLVGAFAMIMGLVSLVVGAAELLFGYGAWFLKPWALKLGVYIQYANIAVSFINWIGGQGGFFSFLFSALVSGVIIYYLQRSEVKAHFGVR